MAAACRPVGWGRVLVAELQTDVAGWGPSCHTGSWLGWARWRSLWAGAFLFGVAAPSSVPVAGGSHVSGGLWACAGCGVGHLWPRPELLGHAHVTVSRADGRGSRLSRVCLRLFLSDCGSCVCLRSFCLPGLCWGAIGVASRALLSQLIQSRAQATRLLSPCGRERRGPWAAIETGQTGSGHLSGWRRPTFPF